MPKFSKVPSWFFKKVPTRISITGSNEGVFLTFFPNGVFFKDLLAKIYGIDSEDNKITNSKNSVNNAIKNKEKEEIIEKKKAQIEAKELKKEKEIKNDKAQEAEFMKKAKIAKNKVKKTEKK